MVDVTSLINKADVLNEALPYTAFGLFAKPIFYVLMILVASACERSLLVPSERALLSPKQAALAWFSLAFALAMPAAVEALWILGMKPPLTILFVLIYAASAFFCLKKASQSANA